jgi:hypothetical protein
MSDVKWSKAERKVAQRAFDKAYEKECTALLAKVRETAATAQGPRDLWRIHDFLDEGRSEVNEKYDYRYSVLIVVFARLVQEGWLTLEDLDGLREDKLAKIQSTVQCRSSDD